MLSQGRTAMFIAKDIWGRLHCTIRYWKGWNGSISGKLNVSLAGYKKCGGKSQAGIFSDRALEGCPALSRSSGMFAAGERVGVRKDYN